MNPPSFAPPRPLYALQHVRMGKWKGEGQGNGAAWEDVAYQARIAGLVERALAGGEQPLRPGKYRVVSILSEFVVEKT